MDSFEWNKIAGWVLAAGTTILALVIVTGLMFAPVRLAKPSYVVEGVEVEAVAGAAPAEAEKPIAFYLASATVEKGEAVFKKCAACHNVDKGGAAGIGPNLYGIIGNSHAHQAGFGYSEPMAGMKGKPWNWDEMSAWLKSPKTYLPGTKMAFAGLSKPDERAAVIAYLNSKSDSPLPLPPVPAETAAVPSSEQPAPAAGKAPDVPVADAASAAAQPEGNVGGPGAPEVTGTAKTEK
ncbi:c-type cytochrome [Glacieibacterium frigidum]|uniref:Cytochrome c family protein n=1 Tax=Glacieibacterium frigidum TaxID=2593303 RepID=A0A552UI72_9SPHN|nr:cytochrome c family protein [Glacieibacterium frigidum]TRW17926.1 cytochrome c family protein [Glacieibacterium frigidum]